MTKRAISWARVAEGEAIARGVARTHSGWVGRTADGELYFVWVQARPRHEPPYYAGGKVGRGGHVDRYGGYGDGPRPKWVDARSSWLCDQGTLQEAKQACECDYVERQKHDRVRP